MDKRIVFALTLGMVSSAGATKLITYQSASQVIGQPSLTSALAADPPSASSLSGPEGVAYDSVRGKIYVADSFNFRILRFGSAAAATNGASAEAVFGQADFTSKVTPDSSKPGAKAISYPYTPAIDSAGTLWVADQSSNRVLGFKNAATLGNNPSADIVLGQPDFDTAASGTTDKDMRFPTAVAVGPNDTLWVLDQGNSRVLRFANSTQLVSYAPADGVLGQTDFLSADSGTTAETLRNPAGLWADAGGRLWVADTRNNRVLRFDDAANVADADGAPANGVLGQPDFVSDAPGITASSFGDPASFGPAGAYNVTVTADGTLWVTDFVNHRVLGFRNAATLPNGAAAAIVLGQANFTSQASGISDRQFRGPGHCAAGPNGTFLVTDYGNSRILVFKDVPPPTLTITTRSSTTKKASVVVKGKVTGATTAVTFKVGAKPGKAALTGGGTSWKFTAKLKRGKNVISVTATGPAGTSAPKRITVTRK